MIFLGFPQQNLADIPITTAKEQTALWKQSNYMEDSGMISGGSTRQTSISGRDHPMDETPDCNMYTMDQSFQPNFNQDPVDGMYSFIKHYREFSMRKNVNEGHSKRCGTKMAAAQAGVL